MRLCVITGDGISKEVIPAAERVLKTLLPTLEVQHARAGWEIFQQTGNALPDDTLALARECKAVLFGAASSPSYPVQGYTNPIVRLRQQLQIHANIRPITYLPVPTARAGIDLIIVRENTEDVYGNEDEATDEVGTAHKIITRTATERITHTAFRLARLAKRRKVTIVHKGNVLPQTDGLFRRVAFEISEQYDDIATDELLVDTAAYWMVKEPTRFDLVLTTNQYGDILSDMAAAWGGGLGFVPSLNIGSGVGIAEPVHGSAPDIAGRNIANPVASILSAALLLRYHWEKPALAERIRQAVKHVLDDGYYTPDVAGGKTSTTDFTDKVCAVLG